MSSRTGSGKRKKPRRIGRLTDKEQSVKFIKAAKAMGADDNLGAFEKEMKKLLNPKDGRR